MSGWGEGVGTELSKPTWISSWKGMSGHLTNRNRIPFSGANRGAGARSLPDERKTGRFFGRILGRSSRYEKSIKESQFLDPLFLAHYMVLFGATPSAVLRTSCCRCKFGSWAATGVSYGMAISRH